MTVSRPFRLRSRLSRLLVQLGKRFNRSSLGTHEERAVGNVKGVPTPDYWGRVGFRGDVFRESPSLRRSTSLPPILFPLFLWLSVGSREAANCSFFCHLPEKGRPIRDQLQKKRSGTARGLQGGVAAAGVS